MKNFEVGSWSAGHRSSSGHLFCSTADKRTAQLLVSAYCLQERRTTRGLTISIILWNRGRDEDRR